MIRLAIRGYGNGRLVFTERIELPDSALDDLSSISETHALRLIPYERYMIEIEFLDEPDINQRFFRFGTDPVQMVQPVQFRM